jgi:hypothetical protein
MVKGYDVTDVMTKPRARRMLVLDRSDPDHPMWLMGWATPDAQLPAALDEVGNYCDWERVCAWAREQTGVEDLALVPATAAKVWGVEGATAWTAGPPPRGRSARVGGPGD